MKTWNEFLSECKALWASENQNGDRIVASSLNHPNTRDRVIAEYGVKYTLIQYAAAAWKTYKSNYEA